MTDTDKLVDEHLSFLANMQGVHPDRIASIRDALASLKAEKREAERERDTYRDLLDSNVKQMGKQLADIGRERGRLREALHIAEMEQQCLVDAITNSPDPGSGREADDPFSMLQFLGQLEGLAIGLEQRGEKSAAHIVRRAYDQLNDRASPSSGEWRTIESAPKDAMFLLVAYPSGAVSISGWDDDEGRWADGLYMRDREQPTHWQPLPAPPLSRAQSEDIS